MTTSLREDAISIWNAGLRAVLPGNLIRQTLRFSWQKEENGVAEITIADESFLLPPNGRVIVVGMGKASGRMAEATEEILGPLTDAWRLVGWVNVPADSVLPLNAIHLHPGRPAGVNEPTEEGVLGSRKMVTLLESATSDDLLLTLISGGGSALAPLPIPEITLDEKVAVTRLLSGAGANIEELNTVRKELCLIKGGEMRRLCRGKRLIALILSDVLGDPLDVIASGATVENRTNASDAWNVLEKFHLTERPELEKIRKALLKKIGEEKSDRNESSEIYRDHRNIILANNAAAVDAAVSEADRLGYQGIGEAAQKSEGDVGIVAEAWARQISAERLKGRIALISGGEPVVTLVPFEKRGKGGRNNQLVLIALIAAMKNRDRFPDRFVFLSGGTDGEDGPTDAAGALFDEEDVERLRTSEIGIAAEDYLQSNDSYSFFERTGGLFRTGPTGTNVCDLRVVLWENDKKTSFEDDETIP